MKIYTKTGDDGLTSLYGGTRLPKSSIRIEACGTVDELNSWIGLLADFTINAEFLELLRSIQNMLFVIGAQIMSENDKQKRIPCIEEMHISEIEKAIDTIDARLEPMRYFILPGGHKEVSFCHIARTVCRRAERTIVALKSEMEINPLIIKYLNRLSDFLFVLCRDMARKLNVNEIPWVPAKNTS